MSQRSTDKNTRPDMKCIPEAFRDDVEGLFDIWDRVRTRNMRLSRYYDMKNELKDLGISIPKNLINVNCMVGWCKKAVDAHVVRSIFDGYVFDGAESEALSRLVEENRMRSMYTRAVRSSLVHGVSALTVMAGRGNQPKAKVRAHSGNSFAVKWDKDEGRIRCGIVLNDADKDGNPLRYTAFFSSAVLDIKRTDNGWECVPLPNPLGRPMMEVLPFDPDLERPLGHSILTPEIIGIVDKSMRDVLRMEVGAEFFTFPQRYILGAADDLFSPQIPDDGGDDEDSAAPPDPVAKFKAYIGALLAISRDENGEIPTVGQFPASPAENFTAVFENDAQRFSGATNVPLAQLGVLSSNYTSSDALNASNDPLILAVETMNRQNSDALAEVARMMMAVSGNKAEGDLQVVWKDPAMPTIASRADAWTKLAAADKSIVGTRVFYEQVGLSQQLIDRLMKEKRSNGAISALNRIADSMAPAAQRGGDDAEAVEP